MATNLSCIGLAVEDDRALGALIAAVRPRAESLGRVDGVDVLRWQDQSSGARLILGIQSGNVVDFLPSLASRATTHLATVRATNRDVVTAQSSTTVVTS